MRKNSCMLLFRFAVIAVAGLLVASCGGDDSDDPVAGEPAASVTAAASTSSTTVDVTFDRNINSASIVSAASQFSISNGLTVSAAMVSGSTVTLTTGTQSTGVNYTVSAHFTIQDVNGEPIDQINNSAVFTGFTALTYVDSAGATDANTIQVFFSRPLNAASIIPGGTQFTINNSLNVTAASVNGSIVTLTTSAQIPGADYTVTVDASTVRDINLDLIDATANTASFTGHAGAIGLVINEVDYDQLLVETDEFVEIFNTTASPVSLTGVRLAFVNGADGNVYRYVDLTSVGSLAAGAYLVVGNITPTGNFVDIGASSDAIQNGPDGIRLETATQVIDSVAYEGTFASTPATGEGTGAAPTDSAGFSSESICRRPNGLDTDNNATDFKTCSPTPGAANAP